MPIYSRLTRSQEIYSKLIYSLGTGPFMTDTGTTHVLLLETGDILLLEDGGRFLKEEP